MGYSLNGIEIPKRIGVYEIQYPLGEGGSSIVFFARNIQTFETYAVKFVSRESLNNIAFLENFEKELRIFSRINHKNIAKYYETIYTPDFIIIVQEALTGGTLATVSHINVVLQCIQHLKSSERDNMMILKQIFGHMELQCTTF